MPASINIKCISPSIVGSYAGCPMRLVFDSDYPVPRSSNQWADFGTLAHFDSMYLMGLNPPPVKDFENLVASAASLYRGDEKKLADAVEAAAKMAIKNVPTLRPGVRWLCEQRKHDPRLLPERVSREGERGFGGVVDLLASDMSVLLDFKFVGKPPAYVKLEYLWQMASYHIVTGVPRTVLLFTSRDAKFVTSCTLDFTLPLWKTFAERVSAAINAMGHADFRRNAYFCEGDQCTYCDHKHRCPLQAKPSLVEQSHFTVPTKTDDFMTSMLAVEAATRLEASSTAPVPVAPPKPIPAPATGMTDLF